MINSNSTLRDLAIRVPGATGVLQDLRLDFCCGGERTLADACAGGGLDVTQVLSRLEAEASPDVGHADQAQWTRFGLADLVRHVLATYHAFTEEKLETLPDLADKVVATHGARHPEVRGIAATLEELKEDLLPHMMKEERILFPYAEALESARIRGGAPPRAPFPSAAAPVAMMQREHERTGQLLRAVRDAAGGYLAPEDACPTWRALLAGLAELDRDLMLHIHFETAILFPRVLEEEQLLRTRA